MTQLNPPLTKDDFLSSGWQTVTNSCQSKDCISYGDAFWRQAQAIDDPRHKAVFEILACVTRFCISPESAEERFNKYLRNLQESHFDFLADIVSEISDPELQARISDILWILKRNYRMAQLAIPAYLESASLLEDPQKWTYCADRIERALRLSQKINFQKESVFMHIEAVLDRYQCEDPLLLSIKLMELLLEHEFGSPEKYISLAEIAANKAEVNKNYDRARKYWYIKAAWHRTEKNSSEERNSLIAAAESYAKEAKLITERPAIGYMMASNLLQRSIEAFRRIPGTKEEKTEIRTKTEEIHRLLLSYQAEATKEMITSSHTTDISELVEIAKTQVRGKSLKEALVSLVLLGHPTDVEKLRQQVQKNATEFLASQLFPTVIMNEMGKVVSRQPGSALSGDTEEAEATILFEMCRLAGFYQDMQAQAYIEPARYQISFEHNIKREDIYELIESSPFIPPNREYLFVKGLHAGMNGDFFTSIHILVPQIENSIRHLLWRLGVITSGLDDSGIQNEHNLNAILYYPEITRLFDENTIFDLRCLLVEHSGSNIRNRIAHGLVNDGEFSRPSMSYIWWLTLRMCCLPLRLQQQESNNDDSAENESA